jgi:hypothetical protein
MDRKHSLSLDSRPGGGRWLSIPAMGGSAVEYNGICTLSGQDDIERMIFENCLFTKSNTR